MNGPVARAVVEAFYAALSNREMEKLAGYLDEDVVWAIGGPVDILPFCGQRVGKALVMQLLARDSPALLTGRRFTPSTMLVDGDRAAVLGRLTAIKRDGGNAISYRIAQFIRFRDDKVVEYRSIIDSFDAAEQMLGHSLEVSGGDAIGPSNRVAI